MKNYVINQFLLFCPVTQREDVKMFFFTEVEIKNFGHVHFFMHINKDYFRSKFAKQCEKQNPFFPVSAIS